MAGTCDQLAAEKRWLRAEISPRIAALRTRSPPDQWTSIAQQVEELLQRPELAKLLAVLKQQNEGLNAPFLLGPYLFQVVSSIEERRDAQAKMPAIGRSAAEVREHLLMASAKSRDLAACLRKGPQPVVVLAPHSDCWDAIALFDFPAIQGPSEFAAPVPLDQLLDKVAASLESMARKIPRAKQHRRPSKNEALRSRTATVLVNVFRERLGHPYHNHVATIAGLLSGIPTDADYVKKVERRMRSRVAGDRLPGKIV
jgi:hypothetical protein